METSKVIMGSLLATVKKLNKFLASEGKEVNPKNMAVGLLSEDGVRRRLAFVYLDEKNYWCVFLNGHVEKYSSLSIGDVLISLFFLSSLENVQNFSDGKNDYQLLRKGKDVVLEKIEFEAYAYTSFRGC